MKLFMLKLLLGLLTLPAYSQLDTIYAERIEISFDAKTRITHFEKMKGLSQLL